MIAVAKHSTQIPRNERPYDGVLTMAMLNYDAEIRKSTEIKNQFSAPRTTPAKLRLAEDLISKWADRKFDVSS